MPDAPTELTHTPPAKQASLAQSDNHWQRAMREAITDTDTLCDRLALPAACREPARRAARLFDLRVPVSYLERMRVGDVHDPLLRQVLPLDAESAEVPGFSLDAVGDVASTSGHGLLHKYHGRALLVTTGACAVHCRYCFRRHFDYAGLHAGGRHEQAAIERIAADTSIREVILSGGDPLSLANARLQRLADALEAVAHVKRLRIHTRTAIVLPARIDAGFIGWLHNRRTRCVVVVHANHANELSAEVAAAIRLIRDTGTLVLNQAVLLRGVNDTVDALTTLSERLFEIGVMPYYLHLLDRVAGTAHYEVAEDRAIALMQDVAARLPGYLVPRLAREDAGGRAKCVIGIDAGVFAEASSRGSSCD